jgi:hypothetical protein
MIDSALVINRFLMLTKLNQSDQTAASFCQMGIDRVESILKDDADRTDTRVINAAACDAFYQWTLVNCSADGNSFKGFRAGDITVQNDVSFCADTAKKVRDEAFDALKDLLTDRNFYFGEVLINDIEPTV